jgi:hypothetical protein
MDRVDKETINKMEKEIIDKERKIRADIKKRMRRMPRRKVFMELLNSEDTQLRMLLENSTIHDSGEVHMPFDNLIKMEQQAIMRQILIRILLEKEGVKVKEQVVAYNPAPKKEKTPDYIR